MTKRLLGVLSCALICAIAFGQSARADVMDPFFQESLSAGNTCASNCASVGVATDPLSGLTTLEYVFKNTGTGEIPSVVAGDELIREFGTTIVGDVIRFEDNLGPGNNSAVAFIFSSDKSTGLTADVGLPASFQPNTQTITESSTGQAGPFFPTTGQPGFCSFCGSGTIGYGMQSNDAVSGQGSDVPEPVSLALLGVGLAGLGVVRRRKAG